MKKRSLSWLLVFVMVVSLFSAFSMSAGATDPAPLTSSSTSADVDGMHMSKTLQLNADGTYSIRLEGYATGETIKTEETVPVDIVLVLDQSGSMSEDMLDRSVTIEELWKTANSSGETLYFKRHVLNTYVVSVRKTGEDRYTVTHKSWLGIGTETLAENAPGSTVISGLKITRLNALKVAATDFIDAVAAKNENHRIAIVGFADSDTSNHEIFNGSASTQYRTAMSSSTNFANYALKPADSAALKQSIAALGANGGTDSDEGLEMAKRVLNDRTDAAGRGAAVILFTDGEPGGTSSSTTNYNVANDAVKQAYALKTDYDAMVFTLGVFATTNGDNDTIRSPYTIKDYMEGVSSHYQTLDDLSKLKQNPAPEKDTSAAYYQKVTGNSSDNVSLSDLFENIAEAISAGTSVTLDETAVMKDVIKVQNYALPANATVKVETVKGTQSTENGEIVFDDSTIEDVTNQVTMVKSGDTVTVEGFDYAGNYICYGKPANAAMGLAENQGKKLVVTISGLVPNKDGQLDSNGVCGIFENADAAEPAVAVDSPSAVIGQRTYVIDFNAKMKLAENAMLVNADTAEVNGANGRFTKDGSTVSYQLVPDAAVAAGADLSLSGADSAMVFGNFYSTDRSSSSKAVESGAKRWMKVSAVPADNVYFDDSLKDNAVTVGDGSGYNVDVQFEDATQQQAGTYTFTFTGTGVDVYCTTNNSSGTIVAKLLDAAGNKTPKGIYNYSATERNNIPSVSYRGLDYGTYTLELTVVGATEYHLDGIRVYNPTNNNTGFANLRDVLINDNSESVVITDENAKAGALFVDEASKLDQAGGGFAGYTEIGPKNEIYLAQGQQLVFRLTDEAMTADAILLGLSAPDDGDNAGAVTVNGEALAVDSAVDMYYPIKAMVGDDGVVTIVNTGSSMISITDLKVAGLSAAGSASLSDLLFAPITERALKIAANSGVDPDQVKDAWNANAWSPTQVLNALFQLLVQSLSGLFSGLGNW